MELRVSDPQLKCKECICDLIEKLEMQEASILCTCKEAKSILADESFSVKSLTPLAAVGIKLDRKVTHYPKRKVCHREKYKIRPLQKSLFQSRQL